jgi:SPX domain protein involved in polyphosphate accumulation
LSRPLSSGATPAVAARSAASDGERELKFAFPEARAHVVRRRLESTCRRDRDFPAAIVWTVYYDTPALVSLGEKINSDFLKRKIRVRWYSDLNGLVSGPAFVEAKLRVGTRRLKMRERLPFPAEEIAQWSLQDARLLSCPSLLRDHGVLRHESWLPMMRIRYRRDRFDEPLSQSRISLDSDIAAVELNSRVLSNGDLSPLPTAVLEVKGLGDRLPAALQPLLQFELRKRSFSKFLAVYAHTMRRVF